MNTRWSITALVLLGCGSHGAGGEHGSAHGAAGPPSSEPITAVTRDALYVVNGGDATISVLAPEGGALLGTIRLRNVSYPHHVSLSPDRARIAVGVPGHDLSMGHSAAAAGGGEHGAGHGSGASTTAPTGEGAVLVLDAATGSMLRSRRLEAPNHNAAYSPDGAEIWTALLRTEGVVLVLDAETLETKQTIDVGSVPAEVTFTPDGRYAFVANGTSDDVTVIDAKTRAVVKTIAVGREPVGAWPGADGLMYVDCEVAKTLDVIDPSSLTLVRTIPLGFTPGIAAVPSGRATELWVTNSEAGRIVVSSLDGSAKLGEAATGSGAHAVAFDGAGTTAFITNQLAGSVSIVDAQARTVRATVPAGLNPNAVVFRAAK